MTAQVIKLLYTDCMHSVQLPAKALHFSHNIHNDPGTYSASLGFCWIMWRQPESGTPIYLCVFPRLMICGALLSLLCVLMIWTLARTTCLLF